MRETHCCYRVHGLGPEHRTCTRTHIVALVTIVPQHIYADGVIRKMEHDMPAPAPSTDAAEGNEQLLLLPQNSCC